jgi:PAS domain S-box-containing protein
MVVKNAIILANLISEAETSAKEWQLTFDSASDVIALISPDFEILKLNKVGCELIGKKREELIGKKCYEGVHGLNAPIAGFPCAETLKTKKAGSGEITQSGRYFIATASPVMDKNNELVAFVHTIKDITERKKAEENLEKLKAFDERIIDSLGGALLVIDPEDYRIISCNEGVLKQLNLSKEELIGKTCHQTTHHRLSPCQPPEHVCPIQEVIETGRPITVEHRHYDKDNNELIVEVSAHQVRDPEGKPAIIHVAKDITERKQMETRIREAEKRYHALFDRAPFGILVIDAENAKMVEFNEVAHEQLGYSREEFTKLRLFDFIAVETPDETKERIEKVLREGRNQFETKHRTKNGEIRDVVVIVQAIELSGKTFLYSIYRDVTEDKKIEAALMDSEAKYRQLVELAHEGIWALDTDNCTVYVNPQKAQMLGYDESEMRGKNLDAFLDNADSNSAKQNLESCKEGHQDQCEIVLIRKDETHVYTSTTVSPIQNDKGNCIGTLALVADITERKKAEEKMKESQIKLEIMNEKLRVVGSLTRHDVRNKLTVVSGYSYLLKKKHADQADIIESLGKMEQSVKEVEKIFEFAKAYEQLGVEKLVYMDTEKTINEAVEMFSSLTLKVVTDCHGLTLLADSFLRQLFYNFINNTRKYGKKTTTVRVHYEKADESDLRLVYEDDGVGITFEDKQHLFKQGFSTGGSTGFGLFLTKKMMDIYGWKIEEIGEPGKGAKFVIAIPKTNQNG